MTPIRPEIQALIDKAGLTKLFEPDHIVEVNEKVEPVVEKSPVTKKPTNWAEAIKAIFELKRKKGM